MYVYLGVYLVGYDSSPLLEYDGGGGDGVDDGDGDGDEENYCDVDEEGDGKEGF